MHAVETLEMREIGGGDAREVFVRREEEGRNRGGRGGGRGRRRGRGGGGSSVEGIRGDGTLRNDGGTSRWKKKDNEVRVENSGRNVGEVVESGEVTELAASLTERLNHGRSECIVCYERIRRGKKLWSCSTCYIVLHLHCTTQWARTSGGNTFRCPGCQAQHYMTERNEVEYRCFCGQVTNPQGGPGVTPGSCNDICSRPRGSDSCPHSCTLRCHPGPCPPCIVPLAPISCFCGKSEVHRRCGDKVTDELLSCGKVCGRYHARCAHQCSDLCHPGDCESCSVPVVVPCFCGREHLQLPCDTVALDKATGGSFACDNTCGRMQDCGNHTCHRTCHSGKCMCEFGVNNVTTCACGARDLTFNERKTRKSCLDPLVSCGGQCNKPTGCFLDHKCKLTCGNHSHDGACSSSAVPVKATCRCGSNVVTSLDCSKSLTELRNDVCCYKICNQKLSCKRHRCRVICCPSKRRRSEQWNANKGIDSSVASRLWQELERTTSHECHEICERLLNCGHHRCDLPCGHIECPPCGILIHDAPLECACGAEKIDPPFRCGQTPPTCSRPCQRERNCGHPCPDTCHVTPCPRCVTLVKRECVGGHQESRITPCYVKEITCSRLCGKPLSCGVHVCLLGCHRSDIPCEASNVETRRCNQACGLPRALCSHPCDSLCHGTGPCPESSCTYAVKVQCPCGRITKSVQCHLLQDDESCCTNGIQVKCDDECVSTQRARDFASAIRGTVAEEAKNNVPKYPQFLMEFAATEASILSHIEAELAAIVDGRKRKISFDSFPLLHRQVVHALAEFYNLDTESSGKPPKRRVSVRHRGPGLKPVAPSPRLSEAHRINSKEQRERWLSPKFRRLWLLPSDNGKRDREEFENKHVRVALRYHRGCYRLLDVTSPVEGGALLVEFSTSERMEAAKASLANRQDIITKEYHSTEEGGAP